MNTVSFSIRKVRSGWFVCRFADAEVWASDAWDHDGAKQLLGLLANCVGGTWGEGYAVLDGEPGTHLIHIRAGERAELSVCYSGLSHHDWYPADLKGEGSIPRRVPLKETLLRVEELDLFDFAQAVADAFDAWSPKKMRDQYAGNWMPFPAEELTELKHTLGIFR